jgi:erythromycin esterase
MNKRVCLLALGLALVVVAGLVVWRGSPAATVPSAPFVDWATTRAAPLVSAEPGRGFDDLRVLQPWIGEARVVGVGEATHGSREFFQLKHWMFEYLVRELGFTALVMETDFAGAARVNEYVLGGPGEASAVVRAMRYWFWDTQEVVALVDWMRRYNQPLAPERRVRFYGCDLQSVTMPVRHVLAYLEAAGLAPEPGLAALGVAAAAWGTRGAVAGPERQSGAAEVARLGQYLETHRDRLVRGGNEHAWRVARRAVQVALQAIAFAGREEVDTDKIRDAAMAENVRWILAEEGEAGKVMLWAHNGHVAAAGEHFRPLGAHLRQALGRGYFAVGTAFNQGEFRAKPGPRVYAFGPAPAETFDGVLARVGRPIFALRLQDPTLGVAAARWLAAEHRSRKVGLTYLPPEADDNNWLRIVPRESFDAVIFFDRVTAARAQPPAP